MNETMDMADIRGEAFNAGFKAAQSHSTPSPETIRRFEHIEGRLTDIVSLLKEITSMLKVQFK